MNRNVTVLAGRISMPSLQTTFAENLKTNRLRRKLSQEALAAQAGISVSYVSMLERAQRSPPLDTLEALGRALNMRPAALLGA
jgi:transcriptional regulator with XRE-family HTH domain